jgi:TRAP-type C4-dicarboxylate transport system substrate-binding protein
MSFSSSELEGEDVNVPNKCRTVVAMSFVSMFLGFALIPCAGAQNVVIKMATLVPQGSAWYTILQEMGQQWQTSSGGRVTLRLYPGGVAGDDSDVVRKMRLGTLDGGVITSVGLADVDRSVMALELPMGYASYEEFDAVLEKMSPLLEKMYADKGFVVLAWPEAGWVHFFTKSPVRTPDDLRALKLFAWAGDDYAVELWKSAGFHPVPLPSTEISTALQTGLVSALPTTAQAAALLQWYTHAKNMTDVKWGVLLGGIVVSKVPWERIPADLRPALLKAAQEAAAKARAQTRGSEISDVEAMEKRGLTVVHPDAAALEAWQRAAEGAYPDLRGKYVPSPAFDEALRLRDEYRKGAAGKASR